MLVFRIFSILFPIFAIILVGYIYANSQSVEMNVPNRLNITLFTPALLFSVLSDRSFNLADYQLLAFCGFLIVLGSGLLVLPLVRWLKIQTKTFIPPIMFTNTANMGIPVAIFTFGESALPAAVVLFIGTSILHFTLGIYLMDRQARWLDILKMPIMLSTLVGLSVSLLNIAIPTLILIPIKMLGDIAIPLMLFALGARLTEVDLQQWKIGLLGAIACPLSGVICFLLLYPWLTLSSMQTGLLLLFATLPPAVINYIIAEQYQQEPQKVASIVLLGNLASFITLPMALVFALPSAGT